MPKAITGPELSTKHYVDHRLDAMQAEIGVLADSLSGLSNAKPQRFDFKASEVYQFGKEHWKTVSVAAGAFGLPVGLADPGAFVTILGALSNLWPF